METFKSPTELNFDSLTLADDWKLFKQQLEMFLVVSGRNGESDEIKITILLNIIGPEGLNVINIFPYSEESEKYLKVILNESNSFEEVYAILKDQQFSRNSKKWDSQNANTNQLNTKLKIKNLNNFMYINYV